MDDEGNLRLSADVEGKGYFTVQLSKGRVRLYARGYVGLIPLNERVFVDVVPRVPVRNLFRLVSMSGHQPALLSVLRHYATSDEWDDSLLAIYARALADAVEDVASQGLLREYVQRQETSSHPRGRLLVGMTLGSQLARGKRHVVTSAWSERTVDNPSNRALKLAVWLLAHRFASLGVRSRRDRQLHSRLNVLYSVFDGVALDHQLSFSGDGYVQGSTPLPSVRNYYRAALDLAVMVIRQDGLRLEEGAKASPRLPSLVIDMNRVVEGYLRTVLQMRRASLGGLDVLDGNGDGSKSLFDHPPSEPATPDVVVWDRERRSYPLVIDVKNVPVSDASDRGAIEQVVTYAASYRCNDVVLVHPRSHGQVLHGVRTLGTLGRLRVHQYLFDLGAEDLEAEEGAFARALGGLIGV